MNLYIILEHILFIAINTDNNKIYSLYIFNIGYILVKKKALGHPRALFVFVKT